MRNPLHRIFTFTGKEFWPTDPQPEWVDIQDIAHALSHMARFNGHTREFYSVAQHSVLVSYLVPTGHALWGLLHDASEAYVADLVRPVKVQLPEYQEIELRILHAVAMRFKLFWPEPVEVKEADNILLRAEQVQLQHRDPLNLHTAGAREYSAKITPWPSKDAKRAFLDRFTELTVPAQFRSCRIEGMCGLDEDLAAESLKIIAEDFANREEL